ncbi:uncharacterized protein LOC132548653 isoform X2 [Ylistrum balloti]|uniref:uncharacterized protein LOC132548653 isoform X2 n=1 Tax=Ylistrum balloti TaxID=509963 RepID=UPI002905E75E|nr:uncharacterized protein LOC132548653 isoform X2 [Ylistrum balloti]
MYLTRGSFSCTFLWNVICLLFTNIRALPHSTQSVLIYPFRNTSLSWDTRVDDLVGRLTLKEIMLQMSKGGSGPHAGPAPPIPRLGIGPYSWNTECLRGDVSAGNATSFPQALGLAASFRRPMEKTPTSAESWLHTLLKAYKVRTKSTSELMLVVNTSTFMVGQTISLCHVSPSMLRLNGIPACGNKRLLTDILRKEWGFKGYVVSDEEAIENIIDFHHYLNNSVDTVALCVNAGCNLELSNNEASPVYYSMIEAIESGKLTESVVRESVKPLFYTRMRLGEFDPPDMNPYDRLDLSNIQSADHRAKSLEAAMKSFVLLKNVNHLLPFHKIFKKIAVVGPMANNLEQLFGDYSADASPSYTTTPLDGLKHLAESTNYGQGCPDNRCVLYNATQVKYAVANTEAVFVCLGTGQELEGESNDRSSMDLPGKQLQLLKDAVQFSGNVPVILLLFNAGPLNITWAEQSGRVDAILECFFPAQAAGEAIFRVLTNNGDNGNPAARLPFTWPLYASQVPPISNYSMTGRTYRYFQGDPLYPFGFGLSYSKYQYFDARLPPQVIAGHPVGVQVEVGNIGPYDGQEVIQIYMEWRTTKTQMPKLQLVAFQRVFLRIDGKIVTSLEIQPRDMAVWTGNAFVIEPGKMRIYIGGQQPKQKMNVPSNILVREFEIINSKPCYHWQ